MKKLTPTLLNIEEKLGRVGIVRRLGISGRGGNVGRDDNEGKGRSDL